MNNNKTDIMSLFKKNNYKHTLDSNDKVILFNYVNIISEYLFHISENLHIQNKNYFKFIVNRGLNTIKHVFTLLLLYTKNIDLVTFHTKKSYLFYVEFIGQIGQDNHSYLQLNSKDAVLFVYKKTIFEINNDIKKNICHDNKNIFEYIYLFTNIYNQFVYNLIENMNTEQSKTMDYFMYTQKMTKKILEKIIKKNLSIEKKVKVCKIFLFYKDFLKVRDVKESVLFLNLCNTFLKKILKIDNVITKEKITKKIYNMDVNIKLKECNYNYNTFTNWIFK